MFLSLLLENATIKHATDIFLVQHAVFRTEQPHAEPLRICQPATCGCHKDKGNLHSKAVADQPQKSIAIRWPL
jgi:hypothetical protein